MDHDIKKQFDQLKNFLDEHMVTKSELQDLRDDLPTRKDFSQLQASVDGIAGQYHSHDQELSVLGERSSRMEGWIIKAARKIGLDYRP